MHTVIIGPEVMRTTVFKQFCGQTKKRNFKIIDNKVANKIYNGTWELVENGKCFIHLVPCRKTELPVFKLWFSNPKKTLHLQAFPRSK